MDIRRQIIGWLLAAAACAAQTTPLRIAGLDPAATSIGDGGPATLGKLVFPVSVALDPSGNLYIADLGQMKIRKVTPAGIITTVAGNGGFQSGPDGLLAVSSPISPYAVAVDSHGTVYFTDSVRLVRKIAADGTLATVAGMLGAGIPSAGDGGPATAAQISPWGIALDRAGNLYIADRFNFRVRKVTPDGIIHTVAGTGGGGSGGEGGPAAAAQLVDPTRVALDVAGDLYIADGMNGNRILRVDLNGILTRIAGGGATRVDGVTATQSYVSSYGGIAVDGAGNLYTADWYNNTIRKITTDGIIHTVAGTGQQGGTDGCGNALAALFYAPEDVATDPAGNVYTGERGNPRVREISPAGGIRTIAGPGPARFSGDGGAANLAAIAAPAGLAFDAAGDLYLADAGNNRIREITPGGTIMTVAGANGPVAGDYSGCAAPAGSLSAPAAVAVGPKGALYIADTGNHRVMLLANQELTVFAGTGVKGFSGDGGPATAAQLNTPAGVAVDSAGNVYISDTGNNRLRLVATDGTIRTVGAFSAPTGLAFDGAGNLYVAETRGYCLTRRKPDGTLERVAGTGLNTSSVAPIPQPREELAGPVGVAIDPFSSIYIADAGANNGKLQRITRNCALSIPAFGATTGVATDAQGNIYYSDPQNNVVWELPAAPPPTDETATPIFSYSAFVNAASQLTVGANFLSPLLPLNPVFGVAPGEMVRIRGVCLGPFDEAERGFDATGLLPRAAGGVTVMFDQTAAPLISAQAGEIWAVAPAAVNGEKTASVTVHFQGGSSGALGVQVMPAIPGIFTLDGSGEGQAAALNEDGSINSAANPAAGGSVLAFWATGQGVTSPALADGQAAPDSPLSQPTLPVAVTIAGQPAQVVAAALAPAYAGAMQVNVVVPTGIPAGGAVLVLSVGGVTYNQPSTNPYTGVQTVSIALK